MRVELLSSPGENDGRYVVEASLPIFAGRERPIVAFLAAARVGANWLDIVQHTYRDIAHVELIDVETMTAAAIDAVLDRTTMLLISGGNTFVLNERLYRTGIRETLRRRVVNGLPTVAFSAGTNLCGASILTSNDMNVVATTHFDGLAIVRYSFNVHYPTDIVQRSNRNERLHDYHAFNTHPILAVEDGAWLSADREAMRVRRGRCWLWEKGADPCLFETGAELPR